MPEEDDGEWCTIYGYEPPKDHACAVGICYNPYRDDQVLKGTLQDRLDTAAETRRELDSW